MSTSPASGLSAEAKEFVPVSSAVPLYVDENTVASMYASDHQPLMIQTIYPMPITNSKGTDNMQFPEIEFHIPPSQQQAQFHIDSQTSTITNGTSSSSVGAGTTTTTSQIVLLPTTNSVSGFYPAPQILYSPQESLPGYYPMEYCEPSLINFSLHQPNLSTKSNRILLQQSTRGNTFRQQHGAYRSSTRANHRGGGNSNRNSYYDYSNRRNGGGGGPLGRGNPSANKRISSSYHSHDYNNYYHSSSRSRGYSSRPTTQNHDDYRKNQFDYYNSEKDFYDNDYQQTSQMNDDGTPFEFRPEDFPSLPNNPNQSSDKTPPTASTNTKPASSWNAIVSSNPPRPHSTSPHSLIPTQDSRSDRSRSFNTKSSTKKHAAAHQQQQQPSNNNRASKLEDHSPPSQQQLTNKTDLPKDDNSDDGFIQTKHQHRRLKRRNKIKEETIPNIQIQSSMNDHDSKMSLTETLNSLNLSSSDTNTTTTTTTTKENREITDTNITENNSNRSSSRSNNSSDTSDYDDAVDNFDAE